MTLILAACTLAALAVICACIAGDNKDDNE